VLLRDLGEWLGDDRQWLSPHTNQWISLLDDLLVCKRELGPQLSELIDRKTEMWREISGCRAVLSRSKPGRAIDPSIRRRLTRACKTLQSDLLASAAVSACFDDLILADSRMGARQQAKRLEELLTAQGLDAEHVLREVAAILEDNKAAAKNALGEKVGANYFREDAGLTPSERVDLGRSLLTAPSHRVDAVVWLMYTLAPVPAGRLVLGEAIQIFSTKWLSAAMEEENLAGLPQELRDADPESNLALLAKTSAKAEESDEVPAALVRVVVGEVQASQALALARESAELVISLAALQGSDPSIWLLSESYIRFYDGKPAGAYFHAPPISGLSFKHREALRSDSMLEFAEEWGEDLPRLLPLRSPALRRAAQLALWLRRSRESWEPGRIVLAGRVLEQVAGWAGVSDRYRFAEDYLRLAWALRRIRLDISNCWRGVWAAHENNEPSLRPGAWEKIVGNPVIEYTEAAGNRHFFNLAGVLKEIDFLLDCTVSGCEPHERLSLLKENTANGRAAADWIESLQRHFDVLAARERRIRNALVHGGWVSDDLAASVVHFVDWLATDALHAAIKGVVAEEELVDYFLDFKLARERCLRQLERGEEPSAALFWDHP